MARPDTPQTITLHIRGPGLVRRKIAGGFLSMAAIFYEIGSAILTQGISVKEARPDGQS